jgi:uncharacterized membrane protein
MDWPYLHALVNHFPIVLSVVATTVLLIALITNRRTIWVYATVTLTFAGLAAYPAFLTGDQAAHALRGVWYIDRAVVREHDQAAGFALTSLLITGVASAYVWWRLMRRDVQILPPRWLRIVTTLIALWSLGVVVRTSYLGGKIVHENPKLDQPNNSRT